MFLKIEDPPQGSGGNTVVIKIYIQKCNIYIYVHMYVCMCTFTYLYIYIHRDVHREIYHYHAVGASRSRGAATHKVFVKVVVKVFVKVVVKVHIYEMYIYDFYI